MPLWCLHTGVTILRTHEVMGPFLLQIVFKVFFLNFLGILFRIHYYGLPSTFSLRETRPGLYFLKFQGLYFQNFKRFPRFIPRFGGHPELKTKDRGSYY